MEEKERLLPCPCLTLTSLSSIQASLASSEKKEFARVLQWIASSPTAASVDGDPNQGASLSSSCSNGSTIEHCQEQRVHVSFLILNAIREAVRPFLVAAPNRSSVVPDEVVVPDDDFPTLQQSTMAATGKAAAVSHKETNARNKEGATNTTTLMKATTTKDTTTKAKRRIRPSVVANSQNAWDKGNLVNIECCEDKMPNYASVASSALPHPRTTVSPLAGSSWGGATITPKKSISPQNATTTAEIITPIHTTRTQNLQSTTASPEPPQSIASCQELQGWIELYRALVCNCLVPSSTREIHLLLRMLSASSNADGRSALDQEQQPALSNVISSAERCVHFAVGVLVRLSNVLRGLSPVLAAPLVKFPLFRFHLPDLAQELSLLAHEQSMYQTISLSVDQTALWTLPFRHDRDSRHHYKSRDGQAIYKNREDCRDSFYYQLRSFFQVKVSMVDATHLNRVMHQIRQSSRTIIHDLMESNVTWFVEFFCEMLLNIGHLPIQETDTELLYLVEKDKLKKLHQRLSTRTVNKNGSSRTLTADPKPEILSPVVAAQKQFPGYLEFFFLFLLSADSYKFSIRLQTLLVTKIKEFTCQSTNFDATKQLMDCRILARFLGLIIFSPNWQPSNSIEKNNVSSASFPNGLEHLTISGLSVLAAMKDSVNNNRLVITLSWVVEMLKMSKWDIHVSRSYAYRDLIGYLRTIQLNCRMNDGEPLESVIVKVIVSDCLETFFYDSIGLTQAVKLQQMDLSSLQCKLDLDKETMPTHSRILLLANPRIDELLSLLVGATHSSADGNNMRSPVTLRKLRPSVVSPAIVATTSTNQSRMFIISDQPSAVSHSKQNNLSDSFQSKLRDTFFHQHRDLKHVCEFAASQALQSIRLCVAERCIHPIIQEGLSNDWTLLSIQQRVIDSAMAFLGMELDKQIRGTLAALSSHHINTAVVEMAAIIAVSQARKAGEEVVSGVVDGEIQKLADTIANQNRKRLFVKDDVDDKAHEEFCNARGHMYRAEVVRTLAILVSEMTTLEDKHEHVLVSLQSINRALEEWSLEEAATIPPEVELNSFFEAILMVDDQTNTLVQWTLSESDVAVAAKWNVLAEYVRLSMKLASFSKYGLRNLISLLSDENSIRSIARLGILAQREESLLPLLILLLEMKMARSSIINTVLRESELSCAQ